jgi:glutaredoxin
MMLNKVTDKLRTSVHDALSSTRADGLKPVKVLREAFQTANDLAGRPFCSQAELDGRRHDARPSSSAGKREAAPVMLYFDGKDHRTKKKIEELLSAREIPFRVLDVTDDEATRSWATTQAKQMEFPLVFIAGAPAGGLHELMQLDVNGDLKKRVFGA